MLPEKWKPGALALICSAALLSTNAHADTPLLDEVHTVAASSAAVPVERSFTITSSGTYQITLTDLGAALTPTPAPLSTVKLAITNGSSLVTLTLSGGGTATELTAAGSATFTATPGTYVEHVIGAPTTVGGKTVPGSGAIGMSITNTSNSSVIDSYSSTLAFPPNTSATASEAVLDDSFSVTSTGTYQVTLSDMQFPQSLSTLELLIIQQGGTTPAVTLNSTGGAPASASASLTAGVTYRIFVVAQQTGTPTAGLFGVNITTGAQSVYNQTVPLGAVTLLGTPTLTAGTATLTVADLQYPSGNPLASSGAAVTQYGQSITTPITTPGSATFTATATAYNVYGLGVATSATAPGSYAVTLTSAAGTPVLDVARAVSTSGGTYNTYSYDTNLTAAGTYTLDVTDFGYPVNLSSVSVAVVQGGKKLGSALSSAGVAASGSATASAGAASVLAFAALGTSATGGLFGADLTATGASSPAFETSQGVGQAFALHKVNVTTAGSYQISLTDVGFPASFQNLAVIVTRGTSNVAEVFGGGSQIISAVSGNYDVNVVAQPGGSDSAGTYAVSFATAPPAPVISSFVSTPTSVASGGTVTLSWASTNSTSCTLSGGGGFSNTSEATSGSATSTALTAATTFTLTCTGSGGNTSQTASVTIDSPSSSSHSGGGALGVDFLAVLLGLVFVRITGTRGLRGGSRSGAR